MGVQDLSGGLEGSWLTGFRLKGFRSVETVEDVRCALGTAGTARPSLAYMSADSCYEFLLRHLH